MPQTDAEALRKQIEKRAYAIWEHEGRPDGRDIDHWLQAENEVTTAAADPPPSTAATPSRKKSD